ncbi:uridine kinase [soil metagenome]
MAARVIVLAGPSGAGKSRLSQRVGLPILRLDDFYKDGDDPTLPRFTDGPNTGLADWDHPDSWHPQAAIETIAQLCDHGVADVPVYDIASNGRTGHAALDLAGSDLFVAEGIFAADIVAACARAGHLAAAYCITQSPAVTAIRRLVRDLREHRKPPVLLVKRGWRLMRTQPALVESMVAKGCRPMTGDQGLHEIRATMMSTA